MTGLGRWVVLTCITLFTAPLIAFDGNRVTNGPFTLTIDPIEPVTQRNRPVTVKANLTNHAVQPVKAAIQLDSLVDSWTPTGPSTSQLTIPPQQTVAVYFKIQPGADCFSALYPVHIYAVIQDSVNPCRLHAVEVFETRFPAPLQSDSFSLKPVTVPQQGAVHLNTLSSYQVSWSYLGQSPVSMPVGWYGSSPQSKADFRPETVSRGTVQAALAMHPAWWGQPGTIYVDYPLLLPQATPIIFKFSQAIRDNTEIEPPSDGVTFRVWINQKQVYQKHTDSKIWLPGQIDLSGYAGKSITLRLECHPGPKNNTTCDLAYWGDPVILSGKQPQPLTLKQKQQMRQIALTGLNNPDSITSNATIFNLTGGRRVCIVPGTIGIIDGQIALGHQNRHLILNGLQIMIDDKKISSVDQSVAIKKCTITTQPDHSDYHYKLILDQQELDLTLHVRACQAGLQIQLECPGRITDFSLGPADQTAQRVYYGHGYCIESPRAFQAPFGGHNLSTSHVGFDFIHGLSLLTAVDTPPDYLEVDPNNRKYTLHTHHESTMTLVIDSNGIFQCTKLYRPLYDKQPSAGFKRKAGRFVFDIWGGRYAETTQTLKKIIHYGLTDAILTMHVWQRWGYDYRLPEIYPPNPQLGTLGDLRQLAALCETNGIYWGLHDNYIDFYPDAQDFSYDHICFNKNGQPVQAWFNKTRQAQSYRWRPDHILPFIQQNLKQIRAGLHPNHYFLDVFTSMKPFDYYDRDGNFHSMLETRRCWSDAFRWIQNYLGRDAVTSSEAGHDQLIGSLDGADCQFLQLTDRSQRFCNLVQCADWERIPWFDAVLHNLFSLHGAGYSSRFEGGRSRLEHGIESDDYISTEILTGHALMIDRTGFGRGAVRKYWLAQDFIRAIARSEIDTVHFVDQNIHHQAISWSPAGTVYVNRGKSDWTIAGKTLPPYGYYARIGKVESSIERLNGQIVEQSCSPDTFYFNGRGQSPDNRLNLYPQAKSIRWLDNRQFELIVDWRVNEPINQDLKIFLHIVDNEDQIIFQGDLNSPPTVNQWKTGTVSTGTNRPIFIPPTVKPGRYKIAIGLWNPQTHQRFGLQGVKLGDSRCFLGTLLLTGQDRKITGAALMDTPEPDLTESRWNCSGTPIDFGPVTTVGALKGIINANSLTLIPLPDSKPFDITLNLDRIPPAGMSTVKSIQAINKNQKPTRPISFQLNQNRLTFKTNPNDFGYTLYD